MGARYRHTTPIWRRGSRMLTACAGSGGGQLPPQDPVFTAPASFGFSFSCEDKGGINPPTGRLRIQLSYTDHGSNPIGSSFSIQGAADNIDPVRRGTSTSPLCRFEVIARDTDGNLGGSKGDFFSIRLSSATALDDDLDPATVFYVRAGYLERGNLTVK